jgi:hypothetical protein
VAAFAIARITNEGSNSGTLGTTPDPSPVQREVEIDERHAACEGRDRLRDPLLARGRSRLLLAPPRQRLNVALVTEMARPPVSEQRDYWDPGPVRWQLRG